MAKSIKKYLLIIAGSISLGLGVIGIFLPVLPTTPFLLLASFCYMRSSKRLNNWLIHHPVFGECIYNYITYRAVKKSAKRIALVFLWISLLVSMILISNIYMSIILCIIGTLVSAHLFKLKTLTVEK